MNTAAVTQDVFELVLVRPVRVAGGEHPTLVELSWRAPQQGERLVQVYVDERLAAVTGDAQVRRLWLHIDRGQPGGRRIELLAVTSGSAQLCKSMAAQLGGWPTPTRQGVDFAVARAESLPLGSRVSVRVDGEARACESLWPATAHRGGFGSVFGEGGFGMDAATGPGLGAGELGMGPLGSGGAAHRTPLRLSPGEHLLAGVLSDDTQATELTLTGQAVSVAPIPRPAHALEIDPDFTLHWSTTSHHEVIA